MFFFAAILLTSITIEFVFGSKLKDSKILSLGVHFFSMGVVVFISAYFFGLSTFSLRYGVSPQLMAADEGVPISLMMMFFGASLVLVSWIIKLFKSGKWGR